MQAALQVLDNCFREAAVGLKQSQSVVQSQLKQLTVSATGDSGDHLVHHSDALPTAKRVPGAGDATEQRQVHKAGRDQSEIACTLARSELERAVTAGASQKQPVQLLVQPRLGTLAANWRQCFTKCRDTESATWTADC